MNNMGLDNKWLLLNSVSECEALIARINADRANEGKDAIVRGQPVHLNNGKYAQCVDDLSDYLTQAEKDACVEDNTFINNIIIE